LERTVLRHLTIYTPYRRIDDGYIVVRGGYIEEVGSEPLGRLYGDSIDLRGYIALPGFIDTHIHGVGGVDVTENPGPDKVLEMSRLLPRYGVTAFIPTSVSAPREALVEFCSSVGEAISSWSEENGSRILGAHLEGPYINPGYAGAHDPRYIREPDPSEVLECIEASKGSLRQVTLAPEVRGAERIVSMARDKGFVVSAGHTGASYEEGLRAFSMGVSKVTHIFNAMTRFHHREPGIGVAALQSGGVYIEVIPDLVHLHRAVVKMIVDLAGPERVVLVSDSISAAGMPDGVYSLGGKRVVVEGGVCRLADSGAIAGSAITLDTGLRNIVSLGYPLDKASIMASTSPAKSVGALESHGIGLVGPGYRADIVVLDTSLRVVRTYIGGVEVYARE